MPRKGSRLPLEERTELSKILAVRQRKTWRHVEAEAIA